MLESYPTIDVISPGNFFVSRQAESLEDARMVAVMQQMTVSELSTLYPDAPDINGHKTKKAREEFWGDLVDGYYSWYNEREWLEKWSYDSLGFYQEQDSLDNDDLGIGSKKIFVIDAEILMDLDDSGQSTLYHVVKAGNIVLHQSKISETSFVCGSLIPTGNRWLGIGIPDLIQAEAKEETLNIRAFTDATVQAAHSNKVVDPDQIEMRDVENLGPDDIIRRQPNSGKQGVPAFEVLKAPGPDPSVLQAAEKFQAIASQQTGVGAAFAGASQDQLSVMRMDKESIKNITNKSSLALNGMSRNYVNFLCEVLVKLYNTGVKGSASPLLVELAAKWEELNPKLMKPRAEYLLTADVGVDDHAERMQASTPVCNSLLLPLVGKVLVPMELPSQLSQSS